MRHPVLLAASDDGITRAQPNPDGAWSVKHTLDGVDARALAADPLDDDVAFAGTHGDGAWVTRDAGRAWERVPLPVDDVKSVAASPTRPGRVFAGVKPASVWVSDDGGANWTELHAFRAIAEREKWTTPSEPGPAYVQSLACVAEHADTVLAGVEVGGVWRSRDGGGSWTRCGNALEDCHTLLAHPRDARFVFQGGNDSGHPAAWSRDAGVTWHRVPQQGDHWYGWAVAPDPAEPGAWFFSANAGPGRAHGGGDAGARVYHVNASGDVTPVTGGLPAPAEAMPYALVPHPGRGDAVYAGFANGEVWAGSRHGSRWERLDVNVGALWTMTALALD